MRSASQCFPKYRKSYMRSHILKSVLSVTSVNYKQHIIIHLNQFCYFCYFCFTLIRYVCSARDSPNINKGNRSNRSNITEKKPNLQP